MEDLTSKRRNIEVAREALTDVNERLREIAEKREVALNAMIDYAVAAYAAGNSIVSIMDAVEFGEDDANVPFYQLFGIPMTEDMPRVQRFAEWLGHVFAQRIVERHQEETNTT